MPPPCTPLTSHVSEAESNRIFGAANRSAAVAARATKLALTFVEPIAIWHKSPSLSLPAGDELTSDRPQPGLQLLAFCCFFRLLLRWICRDQLREKQASRPYAFAHLEPLRPCPSVCPSYLTLPLTFPLTLQSRLTRNHLRSFLEPQGLRCEP